jgi:serine phosphatase RsbU (regulator of sigma subunit)
VLYTDGVTQARQGGEFFGGGRLVEILESLRGMPAQLVADGVRQAAATFVDKLQDDLQVLVLRRR